MGWSISLFASGNGVLKLKDLEIKLTETAGGHYTLKVKDLGKMCERFDDSSAFCASTVSVLINCDNCDQMFSTDKSMKSHMQTTHKAPNEFMKPLRPILRNPLKAKSFENEVSFDILMNDLNTLYNGSKTRKEQKLISTVKKLAQIQETKPLNNCHESKEIFSSNSELNEHEDVYHGGVSKQLFLSNHEVDGNNISEEAIDDDQIELDPEFWDVLLTDTEDDK